MPSPTSRLLLRFSALLPDGSEFSYERPAHPGRSSSEYADGPVRLRLAHSIDDNADGQGVNVRAELSVLAAPAGLRRPRLAVIGVVPVGDGDSYLLSAGNLYDGNPQPVLAACDVDKQGSDFAAYAAAVRSEQGPFINDVIRLERAAPDAPLAVRYPANLSTWDTLHLRTGGDLFTLRSSRPDDDAYHVEVDAHEIRLACEHPVQCEHSYNIRPTGINTRQPPAYPEITLVAGDSLFVSVEWIREPASTLAEAYARSARRAFSRSVAAAADPGSTPLARAAAITAEKFNRENWDDTHGYHCIFLHAKGRIAWEIGWTGGAQSGLYWELLGDPKARARHRRSLGFLMEHAQTPLGLFYSHWDNRPSGERGGHYHLLRRTCDALLQLTRVLVAANAAGDPLPAYFERGLRRAAHALADIGEREAEFPQWVVQLTGETYVSGSASGAIGVAALLEAAAAFGEPRWAQVALRCALHYRDQWVRRARSGGGPTDALQSPDSESAYGLLEAMVAAAEYTGDAAWLADARFAADQFLTWVSNRDWALPADSAYGRLGLRTTGTVYANLRNRHLAPGICTYGGNALLRLTRLTADPFYARTLGLITRAIATCQSRAERPVWCRPAGKSLPEGWINESIWVYRREPSRDIRGEVWYGSCWPEISLLLTRVELPSIYVSAELVIAFDHVEASRLPDGSLHVQNPHPHDAEITLWLDTNAEHSHPAAPLGYLWPRFSRHTIPANGSTILDLAPIALCTL